MALGLIPGHAADHPAGPLRNVRNRFSFRRYCNRELPGQQAEVFRNGALTISRLGFEAILLDLQ